MTRLIPLLLLAAAAGAAPLDSLWYLVRGGTGMDEAWAVTTDSAGNVYWATHQTVAHPWPSVQLYKLRPDGTPVWDIRWGDSLGVMCYIVVVREPYIYFAGTLWSATADMVVVCCSTANGHEAWRWTWDQGYGYEEVDGLVVDSGGVYLAGWTMAANNQLDLAVARLTLDGRTDWLRTFGTDRWDEANGQIVVDAENVYVCGRYDAPNVLWGGDALLMAFDKATGDTVWRRTWGGTGMDDAFGMTGDTSGLYVVGITGSFGNGTQLFLLKYRADGTLVWDTVWGGSGEDLSRSLAIGADGNLYIGGKSTSYEVESTDVLLLKCTRAGAIQWYRLWGGPRIDEAHAIAAHGDYLYIAGETTSFGQGAADALLVRVRNDGTFPTGVAEAVTPEPGRAAPPTQFLGPDRTLVVPPSLSRPGRIQVTLYDAIGQRRFHTALHARPDELRLTLPPLSAGVYRLVVKAPESVAVWPVIRP